MMINSISSFFLNIFFFGKNCLFEVFKVAASKRQAAAEIQYQYNNEITNSYVCVYMKKKQQQRHNEKN